jgi:hypothetical protein
LSRYRDFNAFVAQWVNEKNVHKYAHFVPQYEFVCDASGQLLMDFVGRLESFEQDSKALCEWLQRPAERMHLNQSVRTNYKAVYSEEAREIVESVYKRDIELFVYNFFDGSAYS